MTTISKTAAITAARQAVSKIIRCGGTGYIILCPYDSTDISGPSTEVRASDYGYARQLRTQIITDVALGIMGNRAMVQVGVDGTTVEQLVACGIKRAQLLA